MPQHPKGALLKGQSRAQAYRLPCLASQASWTAIQSKKESAAWQVHHCKPAACTRGSPRHFFTTEDLSGSRCAWYGPRPEAPTMEIRRWCCFVALMVWSSLAHVEGWHGLETLERRWDSRCQCAAGVSVLHLNGAGQQRQPGPSWSFQYGASSFWIGSRPPRVAEYCQESRAEDNEVTEIQSQGVGAMADVPTRFERCMGEGTCKIPSRCRKEGKRAARSSQRSAACFPSCPPSLDAKWGSCRHHHGLKFGRAMGTDEARMGARRRGATSVHPAESSSTSSLSRGSFSDEAAKARVRPTPELFWCMFPLGSSRGCCNDECSGRPGRSCRPRTVRTSGMLRCAPSVGGYRESRSCSYSTYWHEDGWGESGISCSSRAARTWHTSGSHRRGPSSAGHQDGDQGHCCHRSAVGAGSSRQAGSQEGTGKRAGNATFWATCSQRTSSQPSAHDLHGPWFRRRIGCSQSDRFAFTRPQQDGVVFKELAGALAERLRPQVLDSPGRSKSGKPMGLLQTRSFKLLIGCFDGCDFLACSARELTCVSGSFPEVLCNSEEPIAALSDAFFGRAVQLSGGPSVDSQCPFWVFAVLVDGHDGIWTHWVCEFQCPCGLSSSALFAMSFFGTSVWRAPPLDRYGAVFFGRLGPFSFWPCEFPSSDGPCVFWSLSKAPKRRIGGSGPSAFARQVCNPPIRSFGGSRGLTSSMYAANPAARPASSQCYWAELLSFIGAWLHTFSLHFCCLILFVQLRLLCRSIGADRVPLGRFCLLPAAGVPSNLLQPLMILAGSFKAYPQVPQSPKQRKERNKAPGDKKRARSARPTSIGPSWRGCLRSMCFASIPGERLSKSYSQRRDCSQIRFRLLSIAMLSLPQRDVMAPPLRPRLSSERLMRLTCHFRPGLALLVRLS